MNIPGNSNVSDSRCIVRFYWRGRVREIELTKTLLLHPQTPVGNKTDGSTRTRFRRGNVNPQVLDHSSTSVRTRFLIWIMSDRCMCLDTESITFPSLYYLLFSLIVLLFLLRIVDRCRDKNQYFTSVLSVVCLGF